MHLFFIAFFAFLASAGVAEAGPVLLAAKAVIAWGAASAVNSFILTTALSTGMSMISQYLLKRNQKGTNGGIRIERATSGDTTCANIMMGYYATAGNHVCPPYTHGKYYDRDIKEDVQNALLTQIIDVSDYPIDRFKMGVWIGEDWVELDPRPEPIGSDKPGRFQPVLGNKYRGYFWIKFYDGRQTEADPYLLTRPFVEKTERPWSADMIGRGVAYAVATFKYETEIFSGEPELLFEVYGARLYDPRRDSTAGGNGPQRFGFPETYEYTENPVVMIYNIKRGIPLPDGTWWGGKFSADSLPLYNWVAAMNKCDVPRSDGKPMYRAGLDVRIGPEEFDGDEPAGVIEELSVACSATIAEVSGGVWHIRVGGPDLPVAFMSDDDIIVDESETFDPFPSLDDVINGLQTQYPDPRERWASKQAPTRYSAEYEAQDNGRRRIGNLSMPTVWDELQVQMLMRAYVEDNRRARRSAFTLPPDYTHLTVLDSIGWTSDRNGFINNKSFEIQAKRENLYNLNSRFGVRERDAGDYDWNSSYRIPTVVNPSFRPTVPVQIGVPEVFFGPYEANDRNGVTKRPAAIMTWLLPDPADITGIMWEITPAGQTDVISRGVAQDVTSGRHIIEAPFVSGGWYRGRAKVRASRRRTDWSAWQDFRVPEARFDWSDLADDVLRDFDSLREWIDGTGPWLRGITDLIDELRDRAVDIDYAGFTAREQIFRRAMVEVENSRAEFREEILVATGPDSALAMRIEEVKAQTDDSISLVRDDMVALTGPDSALAASIERVEASIPGAVAAGTSALVGRVEETEEGLSATSDKLDEVSARTDRGTASGKLRISSQSGPSGVVSRLGLHAEVDGTANDSSAAVFLEARDDGVGQIILAANRLAIVDTHTASAVRRVPFIVVNGVVYINEAFIQDASIGNAKIIDADITYLKIKGKTLYVPRYWERADVTLQSGSSASNPVMLFDRDVPDFDGGGYVLIFGASVNTRIDYDSYARFELLIDNVVVKSQSVGLRTSGANTGGEFPTSISASFYGSGVTNIKVRGWSHGHDNYIGGSQKVAVQNMSLTVAGARR